MRNLHPLSSAARRSGGFTLVELLVVIGIIAILAGVALGPITKGIQKAKESGAMQTCRTLALAEFQYANDNNQSYPYGTGGFTIANALFSGNYVSDPGIFILSGDTGATKYTGLASGTFVSKNDSFDFMDVGGTAGLSSSTPDQCPVVWTPDPGVTTIPHGTTAAGIEFAPTTGIFGTDGMAVAYHSNNSFFRAPVGQSNAASWPDTKGDLMFIDNSFNPNGVTYTKEVGNSNN